jgi:hypothetical protein
MDRFRVRFALIFLPLMLCFVLVELSVLRGNDDGLRAFGGLLAMLALLTGVLFAYRWLWRDRGPRQFSVLAGRMILLLICAICVAQGLTIALR